MLNPACTAPSHKRRPQDDCNENPASIDRGIDRARPRRALTSRLFALAGVTAVCAISINLSASIVTSQLWVVITQKVPSVGRRGREWIVGCAEFLTLMFCFVWVTRSSYVVVRYSRRDGVGTGSAVGLV